MTYAADRMWEEVAYVAYYLHWGLDEILDLAHSTRERVIAEIGRIHDLSETLLVIGALQVALTPPRWIDAKKGVGDVLALHDSHASRGD